MKKILALILTVSMIMTMMISTSMVNVNAATNDGIADFEAGVTVADYTNGTFTDSKRYTEDGYTFSARRSHYGQSSEIVTNFAGHEGSALKISSVKTTYADVGGTSDPTQCLDVAMSSVPYLTSLDQYYQVSFDMAYDGTGQALLIGFFDGGDGYMFSTDTAESRKLSIPFYRSGFSHSTTGSTWYNVKIIMSSTDIDNTVSGDAHSYWMYINDTLVSRGNFPVSFKSGSMSYFKGFRAFQFRNVPRFTSGITYTDPDTSATSTGHNIDTDSALYVDNFKVSILDSHPYSQTLSQSAVLDFSDYVENEASNQWSNSGWKITGIRNASTTTASGGNYSLYQYNNEKGVYGRTADDSALQVTHDHTEGDEVFPSDGDTGVWVDTIAPTTAINGYSGEYYELSFDTAVGGAWKARELRAMFYNSATGSYQTYPLTIGGDNVVRFPAFSYNETGTTDAPVFTMAPNCWYNFKFIIKPYTGKTTIDSTVYNTHTVWIYVNGKLLVDNHSFVAEDRNDNPQNHFYGIASLKMFMASNFTKGAAYTSGTLPEWYIDNIKFASTSQKPENIYSHTLHFDTTDVATTTSDVSNEVKSNIGNWNFNDSLFAVMKSGAIEDGIFGKATGDKSLKIQATADSTYSNIERLFVAESFDPMLERGEWANYEFYVANRGNTNTGVQGFYSCERSNDGKDHTGVLLNISPLGLVYIYGKNTNIAEHYTLKKDTWYKINFVIRSGDSTSSDEATGNLIKVYINDELVHKTTFVPKARTGSDGSTTTLDSFKGFRGFWLQNQVVNGNTDYESASYFDDVTVSYCGKTEPTFTAPVTVSTTDEYAKWYVGEDATHKVGYTDDFYVDERVSFASGWSVSDGTMAFASNNGADESNYARVIKEDGTKLYDNFKNSYELNQNKGFASNSTATGEFSYAAKAFTTYEFNPQIAGRGSDDYSFEMTTTNFWNDGNDNQNPFVQLYPETNITAKVKDTTAFTINFSALVEGQFKSFDFQALYSYNAGTEEEPSYKEATVGIFTLNNENGNIYINKQQVFDDSEKTIPATFEKGEWINFSITAYPNSGKADLYINGKHVHSGDLAIDWARLTRMKFQMAHATNVVEANPISSRMAIDDISVYSGSRLVPQAVNATVAAGANIDATFADNRVIIANGNATYDDVVASVSGGDVVIADSNEYNSIITSGDVTSGNRVVVKSSDGLVYKYYYIADSSDKATGEFVSGQKWQHGSNSFAPQYSVNTVVNGKLIAAAYQTYNDSDEEDMIICNYVPVENATYVYEDGKLKMTPGTRVAITVPSEATGVKVFLWDDVDSTLRPIAPEINCIAK